MSNINISIEEQEIAVTVTEDAVGVEITSPPPIEIEIAGGVGPVGPQGPQGPPGVDGGDQPTIVHDQMVASDHWVINHTWPGGYPAVTVVDTSGNVLYGDVRYISATQVDIFFSNAVSGKAFLN